MIHLFLVINLCLILLRYSHTSAAGRDIFLQEKWLEVLLSTTTSFTSHPDLHRFACQVIATLAVECSTLGTGIEECSVGKAAVHIVLQAMRNFVEEKDLQLAACGSLACICEHLVARPSSVPDSGQLREEIISGGGIRQIAAAMTYHSTDSRLHTVGLIALTHLLPVDCTLYPEEELLARNSIYESMFRFLENKEIQLNACRALRKCEIIDPEDVLEALMNVQNSIRRHGNNDKILKAAAEVFKWLGADEVDQWVKRVLQSPTSVGKVFWKTLES